MSEEMKQEKRQEQVDVSESPEREKPVEKKESYGEQREKTERLKAQTEAKEIFSDVEDTEGVSKELSAIKGRERKFSFPTKNEPI